MSKSNVFIERSVRGALSFFKDSLYAEDCAARPGLLQSIDPRIKLVVFLMFIGAVLYSRDVRMVGALYALCLALVSVSRIPLAFFLKRTWIAIPLFSFFVAFPALFSAFSPGEPLYTIHLGTHTLTITRQGSASVFLFLSRIITSVSFVALLALTTRHAALLAALRFLGIPQIFVMTVGMMYRYLYLFVSLLEDTYRGMKSRIGMVVGTRKGQKIVAWQIASLWSRSYRMSEDVVLAMRSRGWRGESFDGATRDLVFKDYAALVCGMLISGAVIAISVGV